MCKILIIFLLLCQYNIYCNSDWTIDAKKENKRGIIGCYAEPCYKVCALIADKQNSKYDTFLPIYIPEKANYIQCYNYAHFFHNDLPVVILSQHLFDGLAIFYDSFDCDPDWNEISYYPPYKVILKQLQQSMRSIITKSNLYTRVMQSVMREFLGMFIMDLCCYKFVYQPYDQTTKTIFLKIRDHKTSEEIVINFSISSILSIFFYYEMKNSLAVNSKNCNIPQVIRQVLPPFHVYIYDKIKNSIIDNSDIVDKKKWQKNAIYNIVNSFSLIFYNEIEINTRLNIIEELIDQYF